MPAKSKKDPRIDKYIKTAPAFAQPILKHLRKAVREACPQVQETMKWDAPWYLHRDKVLCGTVTFKSHCALLFNNGSWITKAHGASAKVMIKTLRRIGALSDLPKPNQLKSFLKLAATFNEPGEKPIKRPPRRKKPPVKTPPDFMRALRAHQKAMANYEAFSPSNKRYYVDWITEAKTEVTREKRLEKAVECIAAGKTRHYL